MGTVGVQFEEFPTTTAVYLGNEDNAANVQDDQVQDETLAVESTNLTKLFKRRRRATAVLRGDSESALPPKCCDRCKSDLNWKLMVQCATCAFRCHLYCFTPPLKQHPAFLIRRQQQNSQGDQVNSPPVWKCEKCEGTAVVFNVNPRPSTSSAKLSMKMMKSARATIKRNSDSIAAATTPVVEVIASTEDQNDAEPGWIQPVQPQWLEQSAVVFDWYRFRSEKAEVLRGLDSETNLCRNGVNELVFYSKSYALMKKTAAVWREYVSKRQRFRHQQDVETKAILYPSVKGHVMQIQTSADISTVIDVHEEDWDGIEDEDEDFGLVDVTLYKTYSRRPPQLPLLWEGEPPSAWMCWTTNELREVSDILDEMKEGVCMINEDYGVPSPRQDVIIDAVTEVEQGMENSDEGIQDDSHSNLGTYAAAVIVQRAFARHRLWRRRVERANRERRAYEVATRRAKAQSSVALLRTCIQFIVLLMKMLGQTRTKKAMLMVLRDAAEEARVKNSSPLTTASCSEADVNLERGRVQQLAEVRIRRFFVRRVHPYVKLKKKVMALRLQQWWKRISYIHMWREAVVAIRRLQLARQVQASIKIQHFYRQLRTHRRFAELIKKHALKKLRRVLTSWLMSRLAKKEAKRCAAYEAAQLSNTADDSLPESTPLDDILEKKGMELYQRGDFWNSASILERLCELRSGNLTRDLQQTLAYSHHMTWYLSYDQFNLSRAHELYCASLEGTTTGERVDPLILQDLAVVSMHKEYLGDSLRLLAKLIEYFARHPHFPLWLLLAAVQLQQQGEWEQSVEYLSYLHDIPPPPYMERDMLALCAMGYEQLAITVPETRHAKASLAKEAWRAALRQWNLDKMTTERPGSASTTRGRADGRALTSQQKWELLTDLGQRAQEQGHYLMACKVYIYALERDGTKSNGDLESRTAAWWNLADAFRHLGHLDLYLNAAQRTLSDRSDQTQVDGELVKSWGDIADQQACSFQTELKTLTVLEKLRQLRDG